MLKITWFLCQLLMNCIMYTWHILYVNIIQNIIIEKTILDFTRKRSEDLGIVKLIKTFIQESINNHIGTELLCKIWGLLVLVDVGNGAMVLERRHWVLKKCLFQFFSNFFKFYFFLKKDKQIPSASNKMKTSIWWDGWYRESREGGRGS